MFNQKAKKYSINKRNWNSESVEKFYFAHNK